MMLQKKTLNTENQKSYNFNEREMKSLTGKNSHVNSSTSLPTQQSVDLESERSQTATHLSPVSVIASVVLITSITLAFTTDAVLLEGLFSSLAIVSGALIMKSLTK